MKALKSAGLPLRALAFVVALVLDDWVRVASGWTTDTAGVVNQRLTAASSSSHASRFSSYNSLVLTPRTRPALNLSLDPYVVSNAPYERSSWRGFVSARQRRGSWKRTLASSLVSSSSRTSFSLGALAATKDHSSGKEKDDAGEFPSSLFRREETTGQNTDKAPTEASEAAESATTRTINQRLLADLQQAAELEARGASAGSKKKKIGLSPFASGKTDAERQAAIEEARDLNGVNPLVAIGGSLVALAGAAGLWALTNSLAELFATHPVQSDLYVVQRATAVFRNVVMGLAALASGFFGVTGVGILLLGIRVAYGVAKGELDPTPIRSASSADEGIQWSEVWELMTGQTGRRARKRNDSSDGAS